MATPIDDLIARGLGRAGARAGSGMPGGTSPAGPARDISDLVEKSIPNRQHPELTESQRDELKFWSEEHGERAVGEKLREFGFESRPIPYDGWNPLKHGQYAIRRPGGDWYRVEESGFPSSFGEAWRDLKDYRGDAVKDVVSMGYGAAGAALGSAGGPLGTLGGATAGAALGGAAAQGAKQTVGELLGYHDISGREAAGAMGREAAIQGAGELAGRAVIDPAMRAAGRGLKKVYMGATGRGAKEAVPTQLDFFKEAPAMAPTEQALRETGDLPPGAPELKLPPESPDAAYMPREEGYVPRERPLLEPEPLRVDDSRWKPPVDEDARFRPPEAPEVPRVEPDLPPPEPARPIEEFVSEPPPGRSRRDVLSEGKQWKPWERELEFVETGDLTRKELPPEPPPSPPRTKEHKEFFDQGDDPSKRWYPWRDKTWKSRPREESLPEPELPVEGPPTPVPEPARPPVEDRVAATQEGPAALPEQEAPYQMRKPLGDKFARQEMPPLRKQVPVGPAEPLSATKARPKKKVRVEEEVYEDEPLDPQKVFHTKGHLKSADLAKRIYEEAGENQPNLPIEGVEYKPHHISTVRDVIGDHKPGEYFRVVAKKNDESNRVFERVRLDKPDDVEIKNIDPEGQKRKKALHYLKLVFEEVEPGKHQMRYVHLDDVVSVSRSDGTSVRFNRRKTKRVRMVDAPEAAAIPERVPKGKKKTVRIEQTSPEEPSVARPPRKPIWADTAGPKPREPADVPPLADELEARTARERFRETRAAEKPKPRRVVTDLEAPLPKEAPPEAHRWWQKTGRLAGRAIEEVGQTLQIPDRAIDRMLNKYLGEEQVPRWARAMLKLGGGFGGAFSLGGKWAGIALVASKFAGQGLENAGKRLQKIAMDRNTTAAIRKAASEAVKAGKKSPAGQVIMRAVLLMILESEEYDGEEAPKSRRKLKVRIGDS